MSPRLSSPAHPSQSGGVTPGGAGGAGSGAGRGRGRGNATRDREIIGQTVRIKQGPYKGIHEIRIYTTRTLTLVSIRLSF